MLDDYIIISHLRQFSFVLAFLTSLIKFILWLRFSASKRKTEDMGGGQGPYGPALLHNDINILFIENNICTHPIQGWKVVEKGLVLTDTENHNNFTHVDTVERVL